MIFLIIVCLTLNLATFEAQGVNNVIKEANKVGNDTNKNITTKQLNNDSRKIDGATQFNFSEGKEYYSESFTTSAESISLQVTEEYTSYDDYYNVSQKTEAAAENISWTAGLHHHHTKWEEFGPFFTFTMFIVITGLTKIGFHHGGYLLSRLPESWLLISAGLLVGAIMHAMGVDTSSQVVVHPDEHPVLQWPLLPEFTPTLFFVVLLPPIILESAYSLYDRQFAHNFKIVLLYAVVGTAFNAFAIGALLYLAVIAGALGSLEGSLKSSTKFTLSLSDCFLFGSVVSAVDPVAVLAIFHEVGVSKDLYFLLFGESLLNDAVTVALYSTMVTFTQLEKIEGSEYGVAAVILLAAGVGGALLGVIGGLITALVTRATRQSRVVEPLAILGLAYLTYLTAELFHLSGIVSSVSDSAIFLFLGAALVRELYVWHTVFIIWAIILCLACRFAGVFGLTAMSNAVSERHVDWKHQLVLSYGGLRGATCYALACMLDEAYPPAQLFSTAALAIVLFTVFIQGGTIKFLVRRLKIQKLASAKKTLSEEINEHISTMMLAGIEEIACARGDYYIKRKLELLDNRYLKKIFLNSDAESDLQLLFEKISLMEHYNHLYRRKSNFSQEGSGIMSRNHDKLFLRTFGVPLALPHSVQGPQPRHGLRLALLRESRRRRNQTQEVAPETLHEAIRDAPFQQLQYPHNRMMVPDRPREMQEQLDLRRASIVINRSSSAASSTGPELSIMK